MGRPKKYATPEEAKAAHKEQKKQASSRWRKNNPDKAKANRERYCKNNPDKVKETKKKYYENNKQSYVARAAKWSATNPERAKELHAKAVKKYQLRELEKEQRLYLINIRDES